MCMARLGGGGCGYLGMTMILVVALVLVCFAFSTTSVTAAEIIKEETDKTEAGLETPPPYGPITLGAWGYVPFKSFDHPGYDGIKSIKIRHGSIIDGMQVTYAYNGQTVETPAIGGSGGILQEIHLDYPNEYLYGIEGIVGATPYAPASVSGLKLYTNKNTYGPFGTQDGVDDRRAFQSIACGRKIVGFHGNTIPQTFLASIGVYVSEYMVQKKQA